MNSIQHSPVRGGAKAGDSFGIGGKNMGPGQKSLKPMSQAALQEQAKKSAQSTMVALEQPKL